MPNKVFELSIVVFIIARFSVAPYIRKLRTVYSYFFRVFDNNGFLSDITSLKVFKRNSFPSLP